MALCYIIKLKVGGINCYKIGEKEEGSNRTEKLVETYQMHNARLVDISILNEGIKLPENEEYRLNDKTIRAKLNSKIFTPVDSELIKALVYDTDGATEFVRLLDGINLTDEEVEAEVIKTINKLAENEKNFKHKLFKVDLSKVDNTEADKHLVRTPLIRQIDKKTKFWEDIDKTILFIGQFEHEWIASLAGYHNIYILYDNRDTEYKYIPFIQDRIKTFTKSEDLLKMCKKFDVIIANPPYAIGNELTKAVVENVEFDTYINLMPVSKYKKNALFSYVESIEKAEDSFEDATVGDCLALAELTDHPCGKYNSWDDFTLVTYDETFRKFYEENRRRTPSFIASGMDTTKLLAPITNSSFYIMNRVCAHGIDMSGYGYDFNTGKSSCEEITNSIVRKKNDAPIVRGQVVYFNTELERNNFADFWYRNGRNGLMHKLVKGLNKVGGDCNDAIPNVDWTRSWTDEELLADYGYTEEEIKNILG